jgi:hypothetical protein
MTEQPTALRLADNLIKYLGGNTATQAAAELRRLHAQRDALLEALKYHQEQTRPIQRSIDAIKAVEGEK